MRCIVAAVLAGLMAVGPAAAADPGEAVSGAVGGFGRGLVQEQDVGLVFDYARDAFAAALQGREAPPPERLMRRGEAIVEEMKRRGAVAGRVILDALEQSIREGVREAPAATPPRPLQRI